VINDVFVELTISEYSFATYQTPKLNGELRALIIESYGLVDIEITSELGYEVYKEMQYVGVHYLPLTISNISPNAHKRNFGSSYFLLNEKLNITIKGKQGTNVKIILRGV